MHVTPDCYRGEIARTKEAIAQLEIGAPERISGRHIVRHRMLVRQLAALEQGLERAAARRAASGVRREEQGNERED